jgi:DNA-binding NtrC family response regulator
MENPFEAHPTIFVVDDDLDIAKMLSVILQMNLFDAKPYDLPREALAAARALAPDYLISDISMPEMNGIELAIHMREEMPSCKVLLFSGEGHSSSLLEDARAAGHSFALVQKPIRPEDLIAALKEL